MDSMPGEYLHVPGATLYYEIHGKGPLLFLIAGGSGGASTFANLIPQLSDSFTIIGYDRRGYGESALDDPNQDVSVGIHADDAHWLLAALTNKPAYVFGTGAGALIAFDLTARFPEQVRRLIAHEPPATDLLPDGRNPLAGIDPADNGLDAFKTFTAQLGVTYDELEPGVAAPQENPEAAEINARAFFRYTAGAVKRYRLDLDTLRTLTSRIVIVSGLTGRDYIGYFGAVAIAQQLDLPMHDFPGNRTAYVSQPSAFADAIRSGLGHSS